MNYKKKSTKKLKNKNKRFFAEKSITKNSEEFDIGKLPVSTDYGCDIEESKKKATKKLKNKNKRFFAKEDNKEISEELNVEKVSLNTNYDIEKNEKRATKKLKNKNQRLFAKKDDIEISEELNVEREPVNTNYDIEKNEKKATKKLKNKNQHLFAKTDDIEISEELNVEREPVNTNYNIEKKTTKKLKNKNQRFFTKKNSTEFSAELNHIDDLQKNGNTNFTKSKKRKLIIFLINFCAALIISFLLIYTSFGNKTVNNNNKKLNITNGTKKEIVKDPDYEKIKLNSIHSFKDGNSKGNIGFINDETNNYDMRLRIYTDAENNNDLLFESEVIAPGESIEQAKYSKNLGKGFHKAIAHIYFYENGVETGKKVELAIEIFIRN